MSAPVIDNTTTMTGAEYAAHRGVDPGLISRWKKAGRLVLNADGKILARASDAVLDRDLHPTKGGRAGSRAASQPEGQGSGASPAPPFELSLADAARMEKMERVRLLRMEIAEKSGQLVDRATVVREAFDRARRGQEALMGIADRLSPQLAAELDPHRVHVMLSDELRRVCDLIAGADDQQVAA